MTLLHACPPEVDLKFQKRKGRLSAHHEGQFVLLGLEFARSPEVGSGEKWRVHLHDRQACLIAEPLKLVADIPKKEPPAPAPATEALIAAGRPFAPMTLQGRWLEPDDVIRRQDRVAIFIDAAHTISAAKSVGFKLDWQGVLDYFVAEGEFADAYFYVDEWPDGSTLPLMEAVSHLGFTIRRKPVKFVSNSDKHTARISHDVEIALDLLNTIDLYDVAYVFSGDSDLEALVAHLRSRGKRIHVVSSKATLSRELVMASNKPVYHLEHHRTLIEKRPRRPEVDNDAT